MHGDVGGIAGLYIAPRAGVVACGVATNSKRFFSLFGNEPHCCAKWGGQTKKSAHSSRACGGIRVWSIVAERYSRSSALKSNSGGSDLPLGSCVPGSRSSSKNGCASASAIVMRCAGLYLSMSTMRSIASGGVCPRNTRDHGIGRTDGNLNSVYVLFIDRTSSRDGVPSTLMISTIWSTVDSPANKGSPSSISAATQPTAHTSTAVVYAVAPKMSSGAR
mmetsp:Transcript_20131/g.62537  ORF Transcript_20131/g.62537 Transcript_20131/m.62537 type:complete len:219 (-) Transcript_20131:751-1407(-)